MGNKMAGVLKNWNGFIYSANQIILLLAFACACCYLFLNAKRFQITVKQTIQMLSAMLVCGLLGARIMFVIFSWDLFEENPIEIFALNHGGFALYGAIIACLLVIAFFGRKKEYTFAKLFDFFAPAAALMIAIARWGDYFMLTNMGPELSPRLSFFPIGVFEPVRGKWHLSLFLIESLFCAIIFVVLVFSRMKFYHIGDKGLFFLLSYSAVRVATESLREDSLFLGFVRVFQLCAILTVIAITIIFSIRAINKHRRFVILADIKIFLMIVIAFCCEFFMNADTQWINHLVLTIAVIIIYMAVLFLYRATRDRTQITTARPID